MAKCFIILRMRKSVLLTGRTGFIGKNIIEYLGHDWDIVAPSHKELDLLNFSEVEAFLGQHSFDFILHCASEGVSRYSIEVSSSDANLIMFRNLIQGRSDSKLITLGSGAEYNKDNSLVRVKETEFNQSVPNDPYGYSKYSISNEILGYKGAVVLRLFGVYGKYEDYAFRFISNAIVRNLLRLPITIYRNVVFDYLYVNDLVQLLKKIVDRFPKYKHINVTPDESIDLVSIANIVNEVSDYISEMKVINPGLGKPYTGDNGRLREEYPDFEFTPIYNGIKELYDYYNSNIESFDSVKLSLDPRVR